MSSSSSSRSRDAVRATLITRALGRERGTTKFRPRSSEHPDDEFEAGLLLARLEGRLFFLNAERVGDKLRALIAASRPRVVVLDLRAVFDLEYSALKMLIDAE